MIETFITPHMISTTMEQIQQFKQEPKQEEILESTVKDHYIAWLKKKNRLAEFEENRNKTLVSVDGEMMHEVVEGKTHLLRLGSAAVMKLVIKPTQEIKFLPAVGSG